MRLDIVEFAHLCSAPDCDPHKELDLILSDVNAAQERHVAEFREPSGFYSHQAELTPHSVSIRVPPVRVSVIMGQWHVGSNSQFVHCDLVQGIEIAIAIGIGVDFIIDPGDFDPDFDPDPDEPSHIENCWARGCQYLRERVRRECVKDADGEKVARDVPDREPPTPGWPSRRSGPTLAAWRSAPYGNNLPEL